MCAKICFLAIYVLTVGAQNSNNVCSSIEAYFNNTRANPDCWFNPDLFVTSKELAENNDFALEEHSVRTDDGHILVTFRLKSLNGLYGKDVVFLQHGLAADPSCFMINKENSIAFFLANQGFDVWLGNYRGCEGCNHERLFKNDERYWDFSFHEMGVYDLPANFKYITSKTKKKILYVGHSMGSTTFGIYSSMNPNEVKRYINYAILISPALSFKHTKGILNLELLRNIHSLAQVLPMVNMKVLFGQNSFELLRFHRFCFTSAENADLCLKFLEFLSGKAQVPLEPEKLPLIYAMIKGLNLKCVLHYIQATRTGIFRMFDYGPVENMMRYRRELPPDYNLTDISIPQSWLYGRTDNLVAKEDVLELFRDIRKPGWDIYEIPYTHFDFLYSKTVKKMFLPLLLKVINKHNKK